MDRPQSQWLPPLSPRPVPEPSLPGPPPPGRTGIRRFTGPLFVGLLALLKWGKALLLLLPKAKLLTTSGSMLVSVAAYALIWGWRFAIGFVVLLFIHEMGHVIALRREGVEASAPVFIPFVGALVWAKSLGGNALAEARVGLAGPILGTIGAAACLPIAAATSFAATGESVCDRTANWNWNETWVNSGKSNCDSGAYHVGGTWARRDE